MKQPDPIKACKACPYHYILPSRGARCKAALNKRIPNNYTIPDWCPLPDAIDPEPYEEAGYVWWVEYFPDAEKWYGCYYREENDSCVAKFINNVTYPTKQEAEAACVEWLRLNVKV